MRTRLLLLVLSMLLISCQVQINRFEVVNNEGPYNCTSTGVCDMRVLVLKDGRPLTGYTMTDAANYIFEYEVVGDNGYVHHYHSYLDDAILNGSVVVYPSGYMVFKHTFPRSGNYQVFIHFYDFRYNGLWDKIDIPIIINPCVSERGICANGTCLPQGLFDYRCDCSSGYRNPDDDPHRCVVDLCAGATCDGNGICRLDENGNPFCDCFLGYGHGDRGYRLAAASISTEPDPLSCRPIACDEDGRTTGVAKYLVKPLTVSLAKNEQDQTIIELDQILLPEVGQGCENIGLDDMVQGAAFGKNSFTESMKADRAQLAQFRYVDHSLYIPLTMYRQHIFTRYLLGDSKGISLFETFKGDPSFSTRYKWVDVKEIDSCENYIYKKYFMYNIWLDVVAESSDDPYLVVEFSATPGKSCDVAVADMGGDRCLNALQEQNFHREYGGRLLYFGARHVIGNTYPVSGFDVDKFSLSRSRYVPNNPFLLTLRKKNGYINEQNDRYQGHFLDFDWHRKMFELSKNDYWESSFGEKIADRHFDRYRLGRELLFELLTNYILFRDLGNTELTPVSENAGAEIWETSVKENLQKVADMGGWLQSILQQRERDGRWPGLIQEALDAGLPVDEQMKRCYDERYYKKTIECKELKPPEWVRVSDVYPENVIIEAWSILTRSEKDRIRAILDKKIDTLTGVAQYGMQLADRLANGTDNPYEEDISGAYTNLNKSISLLNEVKRSGTLARTEQQIADLLATADAAHCLKPNSTEMSQYDPLQKICGWLPELFVESVKEDIEHEQLVSEEEQTAFCDDPNATIPQIVNLPGGSSQERVCRMLRMYEDKTIYDIMQTDYKECITKIPLPTAAESSFDKLGDYQDFACKGDVGRVVTLKYICSYTLDPKDETWGDGTRKKGSYPVELKNVLKVNPNTYDFRFVDIVGAEDVCEQGLNHDEAAQNFLEKYHVLALTLPPAKFENEKKNICKKTCGDPGVDCSVLEEHYCYPANGDDFEYTQLPEDAPDKYFSCKGSGDRRYVFEEEVSREYCTTTTDAYDDTQLICETISLEPGDTAAIRKMYFQEREPSTVFLRWFTKHAISQSTIPAYGNYFETAEPDVKHIFEEGEPVTYHYFYHDPDQEVNPGERVVADLSVSLVDPGRRAYFEESDILYGGKLDYVQDMSHFSKYLEHFDQYREYETALLQLKLMANGINGSSGFDRNGKKAGYSDKRYGYYQFGNKEFNVHFGYAYGWGVDGMDRFEEFNEFMDSLGGWPEKVGIHEAANLARSLDGFYQAEGTDGDAFLDSLVKDFCEREIRGGKYNLLEDSFRNKVEALFGTVDEDLCDGELRKKIKNAVCSSNNCDYSNANTLKNIREFMRAELDYFMPSVEDIAETTSNGVRDAVNKLALNPYLYGYFGAGAVIFGKPLNAEAANAAMGMATGEVSDNNSSETNNHTDVSEYVNSKWQENQTELLELVGYLQLNPNDNGIPVPDSKQVKGDNVKKFFTTMKEDSKNKLYHMHLYVAGKYLLYKESDSSGIGTLGENFQKKWFLPAEGPQMLMASVDQSEKDNQKWEGEGWEDPNYDWYFSKRVAEYDLFGVTLTLDAGIFINYGARMEVQLGDTGAFTEIKIKDASYRLPLGQYARGRFELRPYVDVSAFVEGSVSASAFILSASGTLGMEIDILSASLPLRARYEVGMSNAPKAKGPDGLEISCTFFEKDCWEGKLLDMGKATLVKPYLDMNASMSIALDILKHSEIYAQADLSVFGFTVVDTGRRTLFKDFIPGQAHYEYTILEMPEEYRHIELEDIAQFIKQ